MSDSRYPIGERRPIASREWRISKGAARWLARRGVSANGISAAGMVAAIFAGLALASTAQFHSWERIGWLAGAALIQLRLIANMLDGMVAIERGIASPVGELYNEVPDRVSDAAILIGAGYAAGGHIALGYIAACVALFVAYVRAMGKAAGAPHEFCGPMAKPQRMAVLTCVAVFCAVAPDSLQATWNAVSPLAIPAVALLLIIAGGLVTAVRRLVRIAAHLREGTP